MRRTIRCSSADVYRIVIPARYGSSRLPGKPLLEIAGRPMIAWVFERARQCTAAEVVIATDDERIARVGRELGADVQMTSAAHPSGTDRVAEVAMRRGWADDSIVVNLQGDEPAMPSELVGQVAALLQANPAASIATLSAPLAHEHELQDPNVVKVVTDLTGRALYFSRAPIPHERDRGVVVGLARRHLGLYAYRVGALRQLTAWAASPLEHTEKLEQLRALEHGLEIRVADAMGRAGPDVNTAEDLKRAAAALADAARTDQ